MFFPFFNILIVIIIIIIIIIIIVRWLRRSCSRELWWPTWAAARDVDKAELGPVVEGQASRDEKEDEEAGADEADDGVEDEAGYDSDKTEGGAG